MYFEGVVLAVFPAHQTILPAVVSYKARGECGLYLDSSTMLPYKSMSPFYCVAFSSKVSRKCDCQKLLSPESFCRLFLSFYRT